MSRDFPHLMEKTQLVLSLMSDGVYLEDEIIYTRCRH